MSMAFYDFNRSEFKKKRENVYLKAISGEKLQLTVMKLMPGERTGHSHEHEQMGYILSGSVEITIGEEQKVLLPGEGYHVPSNVEHGFHVHTGEPVEFIEIFSPPKLENII